MMPRALPLAVLALALAAPAAWAHPPPLGIGGFGGGLLHPMFVPAHLLAILALGLLIGHQTHWTWIALLSFALGLAAGLAVMTLGVAPRLTNEAVLFGALIAGLLIALARPVPEVFGCVLAVLIGFAVALDSPPEVLSVSEANRMLIGTGVGAALLLIAAVPLARRLRPHWARYAARILGAWIAASAILVLALWLAG
jgi:urease accessory protein